MSLTDQELHGRVVLSQDGVVVGEITKLIVNPVDFRIDAIEVKLRKSAAELIGASRSLLHAATLQISTRSIQSIGDAVILSVPVDTLRQVQPAPATESVSSH